MSDILNNVLMDTRRTLRLAGYRATRARIGLLELLSHTPSIRSEDLRDRFLRTFGSDTATYYRIVADFEHTGIVHTMREGSEEHIRLCEEIISGRITTPTYELTHCHGCGDIGDHHPPTKDLDHTVLVDRHEIHVAHCNHCHIS